MKTLSKLALALTLTAGALGFAATSEAKPKCPKDILCPTYYDPVICSNGQVYSNSCFAGAACATDCVPYNPAV